jgi:hypothetical protein
VGYPSIQELMLSMISVGSINMIIDNLINQEVADMVSLTPKKTGIQNTVFISTKGYAQYAPRVKIAIDPPNSFNAASKSASMALHDFSISGEHMPRSISKQCRIATDELLERIRPVL